MAWVSTASALKNYVSVCPQDCGRKELRGDRWHDRLSVFVQDRLGKDTMIASDTSFMKVGVMAVFMVPVIDVLYLKPLLR
jgi:hypothetical protein